jgi:hypothetical protein
MANNGEGWAAKLSCFTPNYIEHEVGGETLHFYPVSVGMAFKLRTIGRPLARSLAVLFGNKDQDHGTRDAEVTDAEGSSRQIIIEPISDGLAKIRFEQRAEAIDGIIGALTDEKNATVVAEILMDSLADTFPKNDRKSWPPPEEFIARMPLTVLGEMLFGLMKANKDVLGPLTEKVMAATENAVAKIGQVENDDNKTPESVTSG